MQGVQVDPRRPGPSNRGVRSGQEEAAAYRAAAEKALGGRDLSTVLERRFRDPPRSVLYGPDPVPSAPPQARRLRDEPVPWQIRVPVQLAHPNDAHRMALEELSRGAEGITFVLDPRLRGRDRLWLEGVETRTVQDFEALLAGIHLNLAPVGLECGVGFVPAGAAFLRALRAAKTDPSEVTGQLGADPLGTWARLGAQAHPAADVRVSFAKLLRTARSLFPRLQVGRIDGTVWSDAGAGTVSELVGVLGQVAEVLRGLDAEGVPLEGVASALEIRLTLEPDPLETVIKTRALRWALASMERHMGLDAGLTRVGLEGFPSRPWLTRRNMHTNLVRATAMVAGGAWAGLDAMVALPYDAHLSASQAQGRRLARNLHWVLREESRLHEVSDPAAGSHFVEAQTRRVVEAAWERFAALEGAGGLAKALEQGSFQEELREERQAQEQAVRTRRRVVVGVSQFPNLGEDPASDTRFEDSTHIVEGPAWARLEVTHLDEVTDSVMSLWSMESAERHDPIAPVRPVRWAEPFERLRDRSDRWLTERGQRPRVRWVSLGPPAEHGPRAQWTRGLLEAGGIEAEETSHPVAVVVGTDARYGDEGASAVERLRAQGVRWLALAGSVPEAQSRSWDDAVRSGDDVVGFLERLWQAVESHSEEAS